MRPPRLQSRDTTSRNIHEKTTQVTSSQPDEAKRSSHRDQGTRVTARRVIRYPAIDPARPAAPLCALGDTDAKARSCVAMRHLTYFEPAVNHPPEPVPRVGMACWSPPHSLWQPAAFLTRSSPSRPRGRASHAATPSLCPCAPCAGRRAREASRRSGCAAPPPARASAQQPSPHQSACPARRTACKGSAPHQREGPSGRTMGRETRARRRRASQGCCQAQSGECTPRWRQSSSTGRCSRRS
mmetsp:Transcript_34207/g.89970  ORF Transcript_34207/g.89970 Transcript_34207/m.89970 type:complete len:241 (+) Transcript_34207:19-741(+)